MYILEEIQAHAQAQGPVRLRNFARARLKLQTDDMEKCPRCGLQVTELHTPDPDMVTKLSGTGETLPTQICAGCVSDVRKTLSSASGGALLAQHRAKEAHRMNLWKSRVVLIKQARNAMNDKKYSEAAVAYEKYMRILEIIFEVKKGQALTPEMFRENARSQELTVVTSVYWDLFRIYDSSEKYAERQAKVSKQLAFFLRYTPVYPDIIRKAEAFLKTAKNPSAVKHFLKLAAADSPGCFIATAAFNDYDAQEVRLLRRFRDEILVHSTWGRNFIEFYYRNSPAWASRLNQAPIFKPLVRAVLRVFAISIQRLRK